ncbi:hypothetical protein [Catellatospora sp. NPDC049609]|uniref:hypothetical protein n=1 Tax=Catellatospora sp. NPDC049609 TaxID=3155505 RepID=UPI003448C5F4
MGIEEKISNLSRRCAGRSMELVGRITKNTRWQLAGYTTWTSALEAEAREKAKDAAKAMEAVAAYGLTGRPLLQAGVTVPVPVPPVRALDTAEFDTAVHSPPSGALGTWPSGRRVNGHPLR